MAIGLRWTEAQLREYMGRGADPAKPRQDDDDSIGNQLWRQLMHLRRKRRYNVKREVDFHPARQWRFDFAVIARGLHVAIELEGLTYTGGRHQRIHGFTEDARKYASAAVEGWLVLRFVPEQVKTGEAIETIVRVIDRWKRQGP